MYQLAICEDDEIFSSHLEEMIESILKERNIIFQISVYSNARMMLAAMQKQPDSPHIILLDVLLGDANGVVLANFLRDHNYEASILFISSTREYALEGYSASPISYLLKPVQKTELSKILIKDYTDRFSPKYIILPSKQGNQNILIDHIYYIEIINRKITIHTEKEEIHYSNSLKYALSLFPEDLFVQCHKSFAVNAKKLKSYSKSQVILEGGIKIPVGRAFYYEASVKFIAYLAQ